MIVALTTAEWIGGAALAGVLLALWLHAELLNHRDRRRRGKTVDHRVDRERW